MPPRKTESPTPAERILTAAGKLFYTRGIRAVGVDRVAAEQILGAFDRLERILTDGSFRGCPYVNAVIEIGDPKHQAAAIAVQFKEQRRLWFRGLLDRLRVKDPDKLATQLQLLNEGALATALVRGDPAVARVARAAAEVLLGAAERRREKRHP